jgi:hypothetical protein
VILVAGAWSVTVATGLIETCCLLMLRYWQPFQAPSVHGRAARRSAAAVAIE